MIYSKLAFFTALMAMVFGAPVLSNSTTGVIEVPLTKVRHPGKLSASNFTRRSSPEEQLDFTGIRYFADYTIGGQTQSAILDTGSSDTWTFSNEAWSGGYIPGQSSSYQWLNNKFSEAYGDGSNKVSGTWALDTVGIGGAEVPNYQVGFLNQSMPNFPDHRGLLGIGPKSAESTTTKYPTYAERLKDAGVIQSNSFSLFSDASDTEATLLLGGIDTAKFKSPLYTLGFDTTEVYGNVYYAINFGFQGTTYTGGVLDSGTPNVLLPQDVASSVAEKYGASYSDTYGGYIRNSAPPQDLPGLDFQIGGIKVTIPGSDLFVEDQGAYLFAINNNIESPYYTLNILGDPILKQLYLFFDIDKNEVAYAPIIQTDSSNLVAVGDSIPESTPAPNQTEGGSSGGDGNSQCIIC